MADASLSAGPPPLFWDDLAEGMAFETTARTLTEADIVAFCALSGDWNQLHCDTEFAAASVHGQRIAPGLLVLSIMSGLITRTVFNQRLQHALVGMAGFDCRMLAPCCIGDTLHVRVAVETLRASASKPDRGVVAFRRSVLNQRGQVLIESDFNFIVRRRPTESTP